MHAIEPDMVLGKEAVDPSGSHLGTIVDVGLFTHSRVKFLVVRDQARRNVPVRRVGIEDVDGVDADVVRLRVR